MIKVVTRNITRLTGRLPIGAIAGSMASRAHPAPSAPAVSWDAITRHGLWLAIAATVAIRFAAYVVLDQSVASDSLAYFELARTLAENGLMVDQYGQHAFYSPGYPLLLAPFFWVFGASTPVAHFVNLALAAGTAALIWRLVQALGGSRGAELLGALAFAVWMPAIWSATLPARENLSTLLMVAFALICVEIAKGRTDWRTSAIAGLIYGAAVLAGTSVVLTGAAFAVALAFALHRTPAAGARRLAAFAAGTMLVLTPWLYASDRMIGRPVITSNGPFNLYIGNNPAANGHFVSMRDTPMGRQWHDRAPVLGEVAAGDWIGGVTKDWVAANPGRATTLALKKLALFWAPNLPDATDFQKSSTISALRLIDVAQWAVILALAGIALFANGFDRRLRWTLAALVVGFWAIHAATYIIPRYRDPVMPVLIALASLTAMRWVELAKARWATRRAGGA